MTRAQALARRAAGTLDPNCVVVITDGPVIGTPGNTSPTQIQLQPVTPTDLGRAALVHTAFDNVAFIGNYDIDAGAAGSLNELTDHWNNRITDEDANAPTVHTQFPYHLSSTTLRDNVINDCSLPGWAAAVAAGATITDNNLQESTVDLTGKTSGNFSRNDLSASSFTANVPASFVTGNALNLATVSHLGTGAGSFSFQQNTMLTGQVTVDAASTSQFTFNNNVIGGAAGGYRLRLVGKTTALVIVSGNRLFNIGPNAADFTASGTGQVSFTSSEVGAGTITFNGPGIVDVIGLGATGATINSGPGDFVAQRLQVEGSVINHQGSGVMTLQDTTLAASNVITSAASTRGLGLLGVTAFGSNVTQNGTGSANQDSFQAGVTFTQGIVNLNATAAGTPASSYQGILVTSGATVNVADHSNNQPITSCTVETKATLNLSGAGQLNNSRLGSTNVMNLSAVLTDSVAEGPTTKTVAVNQSGRLYNPSFDNYI